MSLFSDLIFHKEAFKSYLQRPY